MEGIERLQSEVIEMNDYNVAKIFRYLKEKIELHEKFNNKEKTIEQMYKFIYKKAEKLKHNHVAMVDDRVVYKWAEQYFLQSNEELGIKDEIKTKTSNKPEEKKQEKNVSEEIKIEEKPKDEQMTFFQEVQG